MGPTSSWSFCRRVLALIGRKVPESNCPPDPWHLDGMAFKLQWRPASPDEVPDVSNLPPLDYALFLFNTVKFYFGFLSFMIDEDSYLRDLHEFYENPSAKAISSRYWFTQYLLVLAFGKAFLSQKNQSGGPPGHQYAARAMALLPDLSGMHEDPLTCIQALSLGAVYLQSIDMRRAAFQHVSLYILSPNSKNAKVISDWTSLARLYNRRDSSPCSRRTGRTRAITPLQDHFLGGLYDRPRVFCPHRRTKLYT
jgi:proline utilization trans-activator